MNRTYSRRMLLRAGAATGLALPFLRKLEAVAQPATPPKRLFVFATPNGTVMNAFWPGAGGAFGQILKPLEDKGLRSKVSVLRGLDIKSARKAPVPIDHLPDNLNMLIGRQPFGTTYNDIAPSGISVDQHIANVIGNQTRFASLQLAVTEWMSIYAVVSRGPRQPVAPELSPYNAYKNVFAGALGMDNSTADRLRAKRRSVLDMVRGELNSVRCELTGDDRVGFDAHLHAIREIERGLDHVAAEPTCTKPTQGNPVNVNDPGHHPLIGRLQLDIAAAAFACDLTRVITLQFGRGGSRVPHPWVGVSAGHHGIGHNSEGVNASNAQREQWLVTIENWYSQQFAYFCDKLNNMAEGTGTVLDHTAVLWAHEQQNGGTHARNDMPYVLAGSCGGYFRTGQVLNLGGRAHNDLLLSLAEAMGAPTPTFGDPALCTGPIAGLRA